VFEKRVLRRIFGLKRDEGVEGWRKLHNEELYDLCISPSVIRIKRVKEGDGQGIKHACGEEEFIQIPLGRHRRR
jgi:hypothetical protein